MSTIQPSLFEEEVPPVVQRGEREKRTGTCSICGRALSDPESVAAGIGPVCGGRGHSYSHSTKGPESEGPKIEEITMKASLDFICAFNPRPAYPKEGACRIRVYDTPKGPLVLMSEVQGNPGPSVTNAAEFIVKQVSGRLGLKEAIFVEHYDGNSYDTGRDAIDFDLVTINDGTPNWKHLRAEDMEELIGIVAMDELREQHITGNRKARGGK
jgi:hypothetical protein